MSGGDVYPQLMGAPLPQDLAGCHAMIGQLRALLDEHRASFGELETARLMGQAHSLVQALQMQGYRLPDTLSACRRGARMLVFLADRTLADGAAMTGRGVRVAAIAGVMNPASALGACARPDLLVKVAASGARKLLDLAERPVCRDDLETVWAVGYRLSPQGARWVREMVARGAAGLGGDA